MITSRPSWFAAWIRLLLLCVVALGVAAAPLAAAEWGDLQIRFVYDGEPPKAPKIVGPVRPDESLIVDAKDGGLANVVVWLHAQKGEEVAVHPSYEKAATESVSLLVKDQRFLPHVLLVRTSQTLSIDNQDARGVSAKVDFYNNTPFNYLIPANTKVAIDVDFRAAEPIPAPVRCSIHSWMRGWLLVRKSPCMAVSDTSGKLTIRNLPTGERTFKVWHERIGYMKTATIRGQETTLDKGRLDWRIKSGANDLGEILLAPEALK